MSAPQAEATAEDVVSDSSRGRSSLTAAEQAIRLGDFAQLMALVKAGADLHPKGPETAPLLCQAAMAFKNGGALISVLLAAGLDPNQAHDPDGDTPLLLAVAHHNESAAKQLLCAGAAPDALCRPSARRPAMTALAMAVEVSDESLVRLLLQAGADPRLEAMIQADEETGLVCATSIVGTPTTRCIAELLQAAADHLEAQEQRVRLERDTVLPLIPHDPWTLARL